DLLPRPLNRHVSRRPRPYPETWVMGADPAYAFKSRGVGEAKRSPPSSAKSWAPVRSTRPGKLVKQPASLSCGWLTPRSWRRGATDGCRSRGTKVHGLSRGLQVQYRLRRPLAPRRPPSARALPHSHGLLSGVMLRFESRLLGRVPESATLEDVRSHQVRNPAGRACRQVLT